MSTFLNNFFQADTAAMDPIFYSSSTNGIPSESKLATYMNRNNTNTPTYGLSSGFSRLALDSPISIKKSQVTPQSPEFIPSGLSSSPSFYSTYTSVLNNESNGLLNSSSINKTTGTIQTPIMGGQNGTSAQVSGNISSIVSPQSVVALPSASSSYSVTPLKTRNTLISNDSPHSIGGESSPKKITPHTSPTNLPAGVHQENVGGTIYFYQTAANHTANQNNVIVSDSVIPQSSNASEVYTYPGHFYPGPSSNVINMQPKTLLSSAFFMPDEMRADIQARNEIANLMLDSTENTNIPAEVENYHSLYPLEPQSTHQKLSLLPSSTYKATNNSTGIKYCLRRLHGFRLQSTKCMTVIEMWKKLEHSNVVQLREIFTTKAFADTSLVLVYDYHPGSQTLMSKYFSSLNDSNFTDPFPGEARPFSHKSNLQRRSSGPLLSETTIWSIIMQLTSGLRAIHQAGLACRSVDPTKIIVTRKRYRFSFPGISDIISFDPNHSNQLAIVKVHQQEDLSSLGKLVLALTCRCLDSASRDNVQTSIDLVSRHYSSDLRNLIVYLLTPNTRKTVTDLMPMIGARFYTQLDALQHQCDKQEDELAKEMENGRLYRLLVKLGCINERLDFNMDAHWSETGDRYMLKLFRDYLFHSVTEDGRPWLDHAHIVQCLNKLDAGTMEKVQLMSRDEQSVLIVTYAELKSCLENAFSELVASANS